MDSSLVRFLTLTVISVIVAPLIGRVPCMTNASTSDCFSKPRDCYDLKLFGWTVSGLYEVWPADELASVTVYCDMTTDGGGWTVIQRRMNGSENFNQTWETYAEGFGNKSREFWIGNDNIIALTDTSSQQSIARVYTLRVDMLNLKVAGYAKYNNFKIGSTASNYTLLSLGKCVGTKCSVNGTGFYKSVGLRFSTFDMDYDNSTAKNCAELYRGGWWFNNCTQNNLNGVNFPTGKAPLANATYPEGLGIKWYPFTTGTASLVFSEMKIRPTI
jgi:ficolin